MGEVRADVLIVGAGLAGLTLARQLLLETDRTVLVVERRLLPPERQKVGESTVQLAGYYLAKVLDLEEYLLREHYLKYNLRFYWRSPGTPGKGYEELSQSSIRSMSNVASFQLDRNRLEEELLRRNLEDPRFTLASPAEGLEVEIGEGGAPHAFRFCQGEREVRGRAGWLVDASGRARWLARRLRLGTPGSIRHGASFLWVDGLVDIERLTDQDARARRLRRERRALGHLPVFLATNHFMGEGWWFWVIPLHGKTSLGLVYDPERVPRAEVSSPEKLLDWIGRQYPLFTRDLPGREVLGWSGFTDFAYDVSRAFSPCRWALTGEAGRFSDPLYSPGGDLIALHNTLITDLVATDGAASMERRVGSRLEKKVQTYEQLARALYEAYLPSYAVSYDTLGDQETFSLRYAWELAVYFAFYVFPFTNDLFTEGRFLPAFFRRFARLGPINRGLHELLVGYYRWKREQRPEPATGPVWFDFTEAGGLAAAERTFYQVGLEPGEARAVLDEQLASLEELARWIVAHVAAAVTGDPRALADATFIRGIDLEELAFDPEGFGERLAAAVASGSGEPYPWRWPVPPAGRFRPEAGRTDRTGRAEPAMAATGSRP